MQSSVSQHNTKNHTAVVIGSSMAGLLSARVLADYFDRVIVIERDTLPQEPQTRKGVPQANHVHVLLAQGYRILNQLFPGIDDELSEAGTPKIDWVKEYALFGYWGWHPRISSYLVTHTASRGLLSNSQNSQVKGIKLYNSDKNQAEELVADLVVDASGRSSQMPNWLELMGYQPPAKTEINSFLGYSTCWYECPQNVEVDWKASAILYKAPHHKHGGVLLPVEDNRWAVTLAGIAGDYPPNDNEGFLDCARNLRDTAIYDAIKDAKPISRVHSYRRTENCWQHYELTPLPEGLAIIGDAVCAFNPVYGQGMTTAALGALTLQKSLQKQFNNSQYKVEGLTKNFQKQLAQVLKTPWLMATSDDFRWETTEGGKPDKMTRFMHKYMDEVMLLSVHQPEAYKVLAEVIHMVKQPTALFAPGIIFGVLKQIINAKINNNSQENLSNSPKPIVSNS